MKDKDCWIKVGVQRAPGCPSLPTPQPQSPPKSLPWPKDHNSRISKGLRKGCTGKAARREQNPQLDHLKRRWSLQPSLEQWLPVDVGMCMLNRAWWWRGRPCICREELRSRDLLLGRGGWNCSDDAVVRIKQRVLQGLFRDIPFLTKSVRDLASFAVALTGCRRSGC